MLKKIVIFVIVFFVNNLFAYSLKEALNSTYKTSNALKSAEMNYKQKLIDADRTFQRLLLPNAVVSAVSNYTDYPYGSERFNYVNFNASYSFPLGGEKFHEYKASKALMEYAEAELRGAEANVLLNAVESYINYIMASNSYDVSSQTFTLMKKYYEIAQQTAALGTLNKSGLARAKQQLASARADMLSARSKLQEAESYYIHIIGENPTKNMPEPIIEIEIPSTYKDAMRIAEEKNTILRIIKANENLAYYKLQSAKSSILPNINLSFNIKQDIDTMQISGLQNSSDKVSSFVATLEVPILKEGLERYSKIKQAKFNSSKAFYDKLETMHDVRDKIISSLEGVRVGKVFIEAAEESVSASVIARDASKDEYELNSKVIVDLLKSERDLASEQLKLLDAKTQYLISTYRLLHACGLLTFEYMGI